MVRFIFIFFISTPGFAQFLNNPSFEGPRQAGIPPPYWKACNDFSTPDTQPGFWEINLPAAHGQTYISLFTRGEGGYINDGYTEAIGCPLSNSFDPKNCYMFSVDLAFFSKATYHGPFGEVVTYENPVTLQVWGGNAECGKEVLLFRSIPVTHQQWETYSFSITPERRLSYLILEAGYVNDQKKYGSILVDNIRIESYNIDLGPDQFLCQGTTVPLNVSIAGSLVQWNTGSTESTIIVNKSGIYSVNIQKEKCILSDTINLQYLEPINLELGSDTTICPGDTLQLNLEIPQGRYQWSTGSSFSTLAVTTNGNYHLTVSNGCDEAEDDIDVDVNKIGCCNLYAPNIFTPNEDYLNDFFETSSPSDFKEFNLSIYNRWGNIVYQSTEITHFWDGNTHGNQKAASGVYYWVSTITCSHKSRVLNNTFKGSITLIR